MEAVSRTIGRLDDLYSATQVSGAAFRSLGRVVGGTEAATASSSRTYTLGEGRLAAQAAVDAAGTVLESLYAIRDKLGIADGMGVPSQRGDATRFSVQVELDSLVSDIDQAVARAGIGGINLVSDPSTAIRIQTSSLGGIATITSQPLDSRSLGIANLSSLDQSATEAAKAAVETAIRQVSARYETLSSAAQGLSYDNGITEGLVQALSGLSNYAGGSSSTLPRGSLVNIRG